MTSKRTQYRIWLRDNGVFPLNLAKKPEDVVLTEFYDIDDGDDEWVEYMWTEGNMACDCNRAKYFGIIGDPPCGHSRFELIGIERIEPDLTFTLIFGR